MQLSLDNLGLTPTSPVDSLTKAVRTVLSKYGSDAHLYTFGPGVPILGPELVVNGDFSNGTTGWDGGSTTANASISGGAIQVTTIASYGGRGQAVPTAVGKIYRVEFDLSSPNGVDGAQVYLRPAGFDDGTGQIGTSQTTSASFVRQSYVFTAAQAQMWLRITSNKNGVGGIAEFKNISVREILGYSNTYSGFTAGNYFDSAGTTLASVDGSVGLVLDAAGSVGAELVTNGDFSSGMAGWYNNAGTGAVSNGELTVTGAASGNDVDQLLTLVANKTYVVTGTVTAGTTGGYINIMRGSGGGYAGLGSTPVVSAGTQPLRLVFVATGADVIVTLRVSAAGNAKFDNISIKEVTGIHATQPTPGLKPTERKGIVNLLTWSNDLTNAVWAAGGGASKSGQVITLSNTYASNVQQTYSGVVGGTYTAAIALSGTPGATVAVRIIDLGGAYPATTQNVTLTATSAIYTVTRSGTTVANLGVGVVDNGAAASINFHGAALFQGTLTAAQILAAGGIPLTTTAPASSQAGVNYLEFDGVDDRIIASSLNTDTSGLLVVGATPKATGWRMVAGSGAQTGSNAGVRLGIDGGNGQWVFDTASGSGFTHSYSVDVAQINTPVVLSGRWVQGGQQQLRLNSVLKSSGSSVASQSSQGFALGAGQYAAGQGDYFNGNIHCVLAIKGTVSDADLAVLEKFVAQLSGVTL